MRGRAGLGWYGSERGQRRQERTVDRRLDLGDQFGGNLVHALGKDVLRLSDKVEGSHVQGLEGCAGAFAGMSADNDDGHLLLP